ncbi:squalene synthase HpnC [Jiella sp. M17.18]|uniref:squalene synthase HpnC n=1 Tax=Jiella sp. M17.18 TaxID=3234247 RepID=UPI0034DE9E45
MSDNRWSSGKGHRDENFPVASRLIAPKYRPAILAFYRFARSADDIADHPTLEAAEKLRLLDEMEATLFGQAEMADAVPLRQAISQHRLSARHPTDLLQAFRLDVEKSRYASWDELMDYCSLSAMPVGRLVLDIHRESPGTWAASDALCAALQVINHLQDCGKDYRALGRVYLPQDTLAEHGADIADLGKDRASPELLATIRALTQKADALLAASEPLPGLIRDRRLRLEIDVIRRLAAVLIARLRQFDPLSEPVHLSKRAMIGLTIVAVTKGATRWLERPAARRSRVEARR